MESVLEILVKKEKESSDNIKKFALVLAAFVLAFVALALVKQVWGILIAVGVVYFVNRFIGNLDIEYEYCLIESDIDIDRIFKRSRRKKYLSIEGKNIEVIAPVNSDKIKEASRTGIKTYFAAAKKSDSDNYAIVANTAKGQVKAIVKLNDKMIAQYKRLLPRKFFEF